jgi:5-methylcytosine-specific restriction protein A
MPTSEDFKLELHRIMLEAMKEGKKFAEINAGKLHRQVGDYPGRNHRMPVCCQIMRAALAPDVGDVILDEPPSGRGARLTIRYVLPRPR